VSDPLRDPARALARDPARRLRDLRGRRAPRLLGGYLALLVATAVVLVAGWAADPDYGAEPPWRGLVVDDLRSAPGETLWSLDLAALLAPEAPAHCVHLWPSAAESGLVAVTTSIDLDLEADVDLRADDLAQAAECRTAAFAHDTSRVALVDVRTGVAVWVHDLVDDVPDADPTSIPSAQVVPAAGRVLVQTQSERGLVQAALAIDDGRHLETARERRDLPSVSVATLGRLQLRSTAAAVGDPDAYALVDAGALTDPVWRGSADRGGTPLLVPGALVVRIEGRSVRVDGRTGELTPYGSNPDLLAAGPPGSGVDGDLFAVRSGPGGRDVAALAPDGAARWARPIDARSLASTPGCLLVTAEDDTTTCLSPADGTTRWSVDGPTTTARGVPGQVSDDVYGVARLDGRPRLTAIDGSDGQAVFDVPAGDLETVVAASRTVVYLAMGASPQSRAVAAHDAASGRPLWTLRSAGSVSFWGGALVEVDGVGVARRLGGGHRVGATS
jgi:outer membrane protein assembly factor BamB